jgi:glycosyltransferase involved in cell wall biosynthesis
MEREYEVLTFEFNPSSKYLLFRMFIKQKFFLLLHLRDATIVVCMFSGFHSFLPALFCRIFRKPCLIIPGGTDCVKYPLINYGNFNRYFQGTFTRWSYQLAMHLAPLSSSLEEYTNNYSHAGPTEQGFRIYCPGLKTPSTVIANGYNDQKWIRILPKEKGTFLTVALNIGSERINFLKGINLIIEVAPSFPENKFYLVGSNKEFLRKKLPSNVIALPPATNSELISYYSRSEFYFQLSLSEGFPNALCEAMLCECIPIVSKISAMPEIIGDTGFLLGRNDSIQLKELLENVLKSDTSSNGINARNRVVNLYSEAFRETKLLTLLAKLRSEKNG